MIVIIGLTPTELGRRAASATYRPSVPRTAPSVSQTLVAASAPILAVLIGWNASRRRSPGSELHRLEVGEPFPLDHRDRSDVRIDLGRARGEVDLAARAIPNWIRLASSGSSR